MQDTMQLYVCEAISILRRIANGELEDRWVADGTDADGETGYYALPAWDVFNEHWKKVKDLPPYQYGILQEMWYTLESYDPRKGPDDPFFVGDVANWAGMRQKAAQLADMLDAAPLDWERPSPFPDWFNSPPESFSTHVYDGGPLPSE
jgi:hypothetical protein